MTKSLVFDEFVKIAEEKGWVGPWDKEPNQSFLPKQQDETPPWDKPGQSFLPQQKQDLPTKNDKLKQTKPNYSKNIRKLQTVLRNFTHLPVSNVDGKFKGEPDGTWGPLTASAWNYALNKLKQQGYDKVYPYISKITNVSGNLPNINDIEKMYEIVAQSISLIPPKEETMGKSDVAAKPAVTPKKEIELKIPEWAKEEKKDPYESMLDTLPKATDLPKSEDILKELTQEKLLKKMKQPQILPPRSQVIQRSNAIISELIKLANDLDDMGEVEASVAVDKQILSYKTATMKLYDVMGETGEQLIGGAHDKSPVIAPAKEEGGKVENIVEQQKKDLEVAKKDPTGKYAETILNLIAVANKLDEEGDAEAAKMVDKTIADMQAALTRPFVNRNIANKAASSKDSKALVKIAIQNPETIIKEIFNYLNEAEPIDSDVKQKTTFNLNKNNILKALQPFVSRLDSIPFDKDDVKILTEYIAVLNKLIVSLNSIKQNLSNIHYLVGGRWIPNKTLELEDSISVSINNAKERIKAISEFGKKTQTKQETQTDGQDKISKVYFDRYIATLNKLIKLIESNPLAIQKSFGGKAEEVAHLSRALTEEKELAKGYSLQQLSDANNAVWNKLIPFLRGKKASLSSITKIAAGLADIFNKMPDAKPLAKQLPKKVPGTKAYPKDPEVTRLQNALKFLGFNPGTIDGRWGPNTATAYNAFVKKHEDLAKQFNLTTIANPSVERHTKRPVAKITEFANALEEVSKLNEYQKREEIKGINRITLVPENLIIPLNVLGSPEDFVNHLLANTEKTLISPDYALSILQRIYRHILENKQKMDFTVQDSTLPWINALDALMRQFGQYKGEWARKQKIEPDVAFVYPWERTQNKQQEPRGRETAIRLTNRITDYNSLVNAVENLPSIDVLNSKSRFIEHAKREFGTDDPSKFREQMNSQIAEIEYVIDKNRKALITNMVNLVGTDGRRLFRNTDEAEQKLIDLSRAMDRYRDRLSRI